MLRLVPSLRQRGTPWDHQGKSELSQIFISCSRYRIDFIQFAYIEDGKTVLSKRIGKAEGCDNLKTITFDYPSEYIKRVKGSYETYDHGSRYLSSIIFFTNKRTYGPYKPAVSGGHPDCDNEWWLYDDFKDELSGLVNEFDYEVGGEFYGFYGTHWPGDGTETIGFYMKPLQPATQSVQDEIVPLRTLRNITMIKVKPALRTVGTCWDHLGKTAISQIFISWTNDWIDSIHLAYVEDGNKIVYKIGGGNGSNYMETITFDYPTEYITRISGRYRYDLGSNYLWSITFYTNKGAYGPYLPLDDRNLSVVNFNYHVGGKFCGFFGTYLGDGIESIGFYMKPLDDQANQTEEMGELETNEFILI